MNTCKKILGQNQQITFHGPAYPKETPSVHSRYTHRSSALACVLLGSFIPVSRPLKAFGSTLEEGRQPSRQASDASTPILLHHTTIRSNFRFISVLLSAKQQ